jgi:hypothetical protein
MENLNVIEGNKLIAEFMGWTQQLDAEERWYGAWFDQHKVRKAWSEFQGHEPLLFNESWDWLMPVVEKIEKLGVKVELVGHICRITYNPSYNYVISENIPKIEAVYQAVVEFIKWYNQQQFEK